MGRINNTPRTYIFEGKTEAAVIKALGLVGKNFQFNILQNDISKKLATLRKSEVYLIIDMDEISVNISKDKGKIAGNLSRLKDNVGLLMKNIHCQKLFLILQYYNLEDEIVKACSTTEKKLQQHFKASNNAELKSNLIASQNLMKTLESLGFKDDDFWCSIVCSEHEPMIKKFLNNKKVKIINLADMQECRVKA